MIMQAINTEKYIKAIESLVNDQKRGHWSDIYPLFLAKDHEHFKSIMLDQENIKEHVAKFCKAIDLPVQRFKEYYRFLLTYKKT